MKDIIYEDLHILVCRKPAGLAVQNASFGRKDLKSMLKTYLFEKDGKANPYLGIIHRLDQPVEGIVVFAKNKKAAASLSAQITDGSMKKVYQAVCCVTEAGRHWIGNAGKNDQELIDYMAKDARTNSSAVVKKGQKDAKEARLLFRVMAADGLPYVLVEIHLDTGRHHQIRVQMAHAGLPLFGDRKYNPEWELYAKVWQTQMVNESADHVAARQQEAELALCATELTFRHPKTGKPMHFQVKPQKRVFQMFQGTR